MDVKTLQARLRTFAAERDWPPFHSPKNLAMALMVEAAELLELFQWLTTAQSHTFTKDPHDKERVGDEMADVLLYLLQLADHTGVDLNEAVERKLRKNAIKHPAKHVPTAVGTPAPAAVVAAAKPAQAPASHKVHLLIDWENVQPRGEQLKALAPWGTDVWLFHNPQQRIDETWHADYGKYVTAVPIARPGKNALDFHLSYYMGYISARQPDATFIVVSNDKGYDPMLEHARDLGFLTTRREFCKTVAVVTPLPTEKIADKVPQDMASAQAAPAKKVTKKLPALAQGAGVELVSPALAAKPQAQTGVVAKAALLPGKAQKASAPNLPVQAAMHTASASNKATRQEVQALAQCLQRMKPSDRPAHRAVLMALIQAQLGEPSIDSPRVAHALAQLRAQKCLTLKGDGVSYPPRPDMVQALPKAAPVKTTAKKSASRAVVASAEKLLRQRQTQQAVQFLEQIDAGERPVRRNALLGLLMAQAEVTSIHAPAVVHAMAHLLAKGWVAVQGESVSYPQWAPQKTPASPKTAAKKKEVVKPAATPIPKKPATPAEMVRKVLASLAKIPGNRPAKQPALLAWIRAQIGAVPGDDGVAHKVLSLLQAQGALAIRADQTLTYPQLEAQAQAQANAA